MNKNLKNNTSPLEFKPLRHFFNDVELPQFPVESLPPVIAQYIKEVSTFRQTPLEMAATLVIPVLSTCVQKRYAIKVRGKWREKLCVYSIVSANPAERKSGVFDDILYPVYDYCDEYNKRNALEFKKNAVELEILNDKIYFAKKCVVMSDDKKAKANLDKLLEERAEFEQKLPMKLTIEDSTSEKLIDIAATRNNSLLLASPDCDLIDYIASGRYNNSAGMSVYLKGYDGERVELDRISRGTQVVESLLLSISLTVQPYVVDSLFSNPKSTGRGLTARFTFAMCKSKIGERCSNPPEVSILTEEAYLNLVVKLLESNMEYADEMELLTLSPEADTLRTEYQNKIEKRLIEDMADFGEWGGKLVGKMLRFAGIFHIVKCVEKEVDPAETPVSATTIVDAISVSDYFVEHARIAHLRGGGSNETVVNAKYLWKRLKSESLKTGVDSLTKARCLQLVQPKLTAESISE